MKKTKILLAMLALSTGVFAQENAAKLALAREVIASMHADKMFDGMAAQMKQMATQMATPPPGATPEQLKKTEELRGQILDLSMGEARAMVAKMDEIYADVYSEPELKAMQAFFNSPEGQSMLAKQPQIMAHLMPLIKQMQQGLMPKVQKLVEDAKAATAAATPVQKPAEPAAPAK